MSSSFPFPPTKAKTQRVHKKNHKTGSLAFIQNGKKKKKEKKQHESLDKKKLGKVFVQLIRFDPIQSRVCFR